MTESNVAIAPDNALGGAHNVRTVTVTPLLPVVVGQTEEQQVVTLADSDGNLFSMTAGALPIISDEITHLLQAIVYRLDSIAGYMDRDFTPPDDYSQDY